MSCRMWGEATKWVTQVGEKWNMSLYDSMSNKRYGDKQVSQNELMKSENYLYLPTK